MKKLINEEKIPKIAKETLKYEAKIYGYKNSKGSMAYVDLNRKLAFFILVLEELGYNTSKEILIDLLTENQIKCLNWTLQKSRDVSQMRDHRDIKKISSKYKKRVHN